MDHCSSSFLNICQENNLEHVLKLLKEELYVIGYPTFLNCPTDSSNHALLVDLINTSWNLTREVKKRRSENKESQQNQCNQSGKDEQSQKELTKLENKIDLLEKQNKTQYNELQNAISYRVRAEKDVALAKDNIEKLKKIIESRNHQHSVNLRKNEVEMKSLQGKFENTFKTGSRSNEATQMKEDEKNLDQGNPMEQLEKSHKKIVSRLEKSVETLVEENIYIRHLMEKLGQMIYKVHTKISSIKNGDEKSKELELPDHIFHLSCEEIKEAMDSYFGSLSKNIDTNLNELILKLNSLK